MTHREDAVPGSHRWAAPLALLLVVALGPLTAACGDAQTQRYDDNAHGVSITYDASRFGPGTLTPGIAIAAAEVAVGAEPLAAIEIEGSAPGTEATGMRVAVFEAPAQVGSLGFWRVTEQVLDSALPKARQSLGPGVTIGDPFRVSVAGLEGYAARFTLRGPLEPGAGIGLALWRDPFVYEVVVLCRTADRRLLDGLTRMLVDLRLGTGLSVATP